MWKTFIEELGAEVVLSPVTTQDILSAGSSRVVPDTCLPVKVYMGHVLSLVTECDYLFIPVIRSEQYQVFNCSKFLGLPDMTRAVIPEAPPILEIEIDVGRGRRRLYQDIYRLGHHFTLNPLKIRRAALNAWEAHKDYYRLMSRDSIMPTQVTGETSAADSNAHADNSDLPQATIAIIGHPYLLYDELVNHRLIRRLQQKNIRVLTPEMVDGNKLEEHAAKLVERVYWTYEHEVVGAGAYYLESDVDGVIGVMAFSCGPDSLMMDLVRREAARRKSSAFMVLTLEEHTAEAGLVTRLEAFLDMIYRRGRRPAEVCV